MPGIHRSEHLARFEGFELDTRTGELRKGGANVIRLSEQPLRIMVALLERPGELVLREDLRKRLWPNDTVVEFEHSINAAMKRLRQTLGDSAENPRFIETLARRGYRWKTSVEWLEAASEDSKPPAASPQQNLIGKRVAHYRVLEMLGGGGMGLVYKAEDLKLGRRVALKFLPEELAANPDALERFRREARAASAADHPNICTIYEIGEHEGAPFIAMQLLQGQTLREQIETSGGVPILLQELLVLAIQVADGLSAAHREGVIHRDIKPANVFVTSQGQAKILDFGLAKLVMGGAVGGDQLERDPKDKDGAQGMPGEAVLRATTVPFVSQTGVAMGTAGYMSPEQVRGQKLDARTDIFSFGLVLYEMAAGKRAFTGDTGPELQEAILTQTPTPARELNPLVPANLERIISKALQKDRDARYQAASEMRADLETLKREIGTRHRVRWWAVAAACFVALVASTASWFAILRPSYPPAPPDLKLRQLTANSSDNHVISGVISPDGKYLAYTDMKGLHITLLQTGETQAVPLPELLKDQKIELECAAWFPDATRFLANSHPVETDLQYWHNRDVSIWVVSVMGGAPRLLRDGAWAWSFSPDGSLIAFGTNKGRLGAREIWLMDSNGENARKLFESGDDSAIATLSWFSDGQRVKYIKDDGSGLTVLTRDLKGGPPVVEEASADLKGRDISHGLPLPDGRAILSISERGTIGETCNFWIAQNDPRTGKPVGSPRRLTNWTGFCMDPTSVTKDGRQLAFLEYWGHPTVYVADLQAGGKRVGNARHFTLTESRDLVTDWTADSKSLIFYSNRGGLEGIYRQSLDEDSAQPLVISPEPFGDPHVTPDGKWVLYVLYPKQDDPLGMSRIMRVPIIGGSSQLVLSARPSSAILCARSPSDLCVVAERSDDRKQIIVTAFDPMKGRGPELTRMALDPNEDRWSLDLSPDGTRFAAIPSPTSAIHVSPVRGGATREISVKGWRNLLGVKWAADGRGLFVFSRVREEAVLLHVDPEGGAEVLWENHGGNYSPGIPSPDGRHLAIQSTADNKNMWMMENF